jgi:DNA-binding LytR/AlgR family response regulator
MPVSEFMLPSGPGFDRVHISVIRFIEVNDKQCRVVTNDKEYLMTTSLRWFESSLPETQFARIHRRYLVGIRHINSVGEDGLAVGKNELPVSRRLRPALIRKLTGGNR